MSVAMPLSLLSHVARVARNRFARKSTHSPHQSDLPCPVILACGASSLTFPNSSFLSLSPLQTQLIQDEIHRPIADIAYSCVIPENSTISVPIQYRVRTTQNSYSNWIDIINLNADPIQVSTCQVVPSLFCHSKIRAEIEQSGVTLQNAFSLLDVSAASKDSVNTLDFGSVAVGGCALRCLHVVNNEAFPLWMDCELPKEVTAFAILAGKPQVCVRLSFPGFS